MNNTHTVQIDYVLFLYKGPHDTAARGTEIDSIDPRIPSIIAGKISQHKEGQREKEDWLNTWTKI